MYKNWVIFDGECGFCNKAVLFMAKCDLENKYLFVSNLSNVGNQYLIDNKLTYLMRSTIILLENNKCFIEGTAIKKIFKNLQVNFVMKLFINYTNLTLLNFGYKIISRNRLLLTNNNCEIPSKEIISKFIF